MAKEIHETESEDSGDDENVASTEMELILQQNLLDSLETIKNLKKELKVEKKANDHAEADHTECKERENHLLNKIQELNMLLA